MDDCEKRLRHSGKRFKDVMLPSEPIKLACDGKEIRCHFERPEAFLKRDSNLRNKIYRIVDRANCRSSNIIVGGKYQLIQMKSCSISGFFSATWPITQI